MQVAIAAGKLAGVDAQTLLLDVLAASGGDPLIPRIVWRNLHPSVDRRGERLLELLSHDAHRDSPAIGALVPRLVDRFAASDNPAVIVALLQHLFSDSQANSADLKKCLSVLAGRLEDHEIPAEQWSQLKPKLEAVVARIMAGPPQDPLYADAAILAATWKNAPAIEVARKIATTSSEPLEQRFRAIRALVVAEDSQLEPLVTGLLSDSLRSRKSCD